MPVGSMQRYPSCWAIAYVFSILGRVGIAEHELVDAADTDAHESAADARARQRDHVEEVHLISCHGTRYEMRSAPRPCVQGMQATETEPACRRGRAGDKRCVLRKSSSSSCTDTGCKRRAFSAQVFDGPLACSLGGLPRTVDMQLRNRRGEAMVIASIDA